MILRINPNDIEFKSPAVQAEFERFKTQFSTGDTLEMVLCRILSNPNETASPAQITYIHGLIRQVCSSLGYTFDEMKNVLKIKCGQYVIDDRAGEMVMRSFKEYSRQEMTLAIETLKQIAADEGIFI